MKALSIRQPWASLIVLGFKPVENRPRPWHYRGPLLIHAAKTFDEDGFRFIRENADELGLPHHWDEDRQLVMDLPGEVDYPRGGIIGQVELWDVSTRTERLYYYPAGVSEQDRRWFFGPYGLWLRDPKPLPFTPLRGQLGLFNVDAAQLEAGAP